LEKTHDLFTPEADVLESPRPAEPVDAEITMAEPAEAVLDAEIMMAEKGTSRSH
jgi:hypothetical protein